MNLFLINLGVNLVSLVCVATSGYLAIHDKEAWGYFLLVAALCSKGVSYTRKTETEP